MGQFWEYLGHCWVYLDCHFEYLGPFVFEARRGHGGGNILMLSETILIPSGTILIPSGTILIPSGTIFDALGYHFDTLGDSC